MSHPSSQTKTMDGIEIKASAFKKNLYFYRSIGGTVVVRGPTKTRSWKCAWLCKKRDKVKADRILLENQYFTRIDGTAVLVTAALQEGECVDSGECTLKHYAGGVGATIKFPGGDTSVGTVDDLLPIKGVISRATVTVEGRTSTFLTAKGAHPA